MLNEAPLVNRLRTYFIIISKIHKSYLNYAAYEICLYSDNFFIKMISLNVFPRIDLCIMKRP